MEISCWRVLSGKCLLFLFWFPASLQGLCWFQIYTNNRKGNHQLPFYVNMCRKFSSQESFWPNLSSEWSGSEAMLLFSSFPGFSFSGTSIRMGFSLKYGASFWFSTVTITVAELRGWFRVLLLRGLMFSTVRINLCSLLTSKSRGCNTAQERQL